MSFPKPGIVPLRSRSAMSRDRAVLAMCNRILLSLLAATVLQADTFLVLTDDGGKTWNDIDPGPPHFSLQDLKAAPDGSLLYAITWIADGSHGISESHLLASLNGGETWLTQHKWQAPDWLRIKVALDPSNPRTIYVARQTNDEIAFFRSTDAGATLPANAVGRLEYRGGGFVTAFAVDPSSSSTLYITIGAENLGAVGGLFKSTDGGQNWLELARGCIYDLDFDASNSSTLYLLHGSSLDSSSCFDLTIDKSEDGGRTLERRSPGCASVTNIVTDVSSPATVYASCSDGSLWQSADRASTWRLARTPDISTPYWQLLAANGSRLYARALAPSPLIQRSDDGGQTWVPVLEGMSSDFFVISAGLSERLLSGTVGRFQPILANRRTYPRNYDGLAILAPGTLASVYGENLTSNVQVAGPAPLPFTLAGASVEVNGKPAPLLYASPTQINFQVPFGIEGAATLEVKRFDGSSERQAVSVYAFAPYVLTGYADDRMPSIFHQDGVTLVTKSSPAVPGERIVLHLSGLGEVEPPLTAGTLPPHASQPPNVRHEVEVWLSASQSPSSIGASRLRPAFGQASPTDIGVYNLGIRVPESLQTGVYSLKVGISTVALPVRAKECRGRILDMMALKDTPCPWKD